MRRTPDNAGGLDGQAARTVTAEIDTDHVGSLITDATASPHDGHLRQGPARDDHADRALRRAQ